MNYIILYFGVSIFQTQTLRIRW